MRSAYLQRVYPLASLFLGLVFTVAWMALLGYGLLAILGY